MNARRAIAMFRDTVPERRRVSFNWPRALRRPRPFRRTVQLRAFVPYVAALATIVVLALLLSYAARRVMPPLTTRMGDIGVAPYVDTPSVVDIGRPARTPAPRGSARAAAPGVATAGVPGVSGAALPPAIEELRRRRLSLPVNGVRVEQLVPTFDEARGDRPHEAIDIMSPRGTPVVATEDGRIAKLFWSKAGGHTIYQFDPAERYVYYYAHLDRYADGLAEGQAVTRGQTIGYVGSTGNAKADAPHLHFAIFLLTPEKRWWDGAALDPYPVLRGNIDGGTP
jgi:peptidoglycan LD-endopeptidase LytH